VPDHESKHEESKEAKAPQVEGLDKGEQALSQQELAAEKAKEEAREKTKWDNYIPPEKRRPPDEFVDLAEEQRNAKRIEVIGRDSSVTVITLDQVKDVSPDEIIKFLQVIGSGTLIQNTDDVYYRHETRHDNGQLVDFSERRKVDNKFEMANPQFHEYYKVVMRTMRRGDVAYIRYPKAYTHGSYHKSQHFINKTQEEKDRIGDDIYIRFQISKIKRNPVCTDPETFAGILAYLERVREVGRELMEEAEYANAEQLYRRILPMFKNMPKKMKDSLTEPEKEKRNEVLHLLLLNVALCHLRRKNPREAVKAAKESLEFNKTNPKAYYRLAVAQKENGELEPAKESILKAVELAPSDKTIRDEYRALMELMNQKHKEWYQKMNGFLQSDRLKKIEERDQQEALLKHKLLKKEFDWGEQ